MVTKNQSLRATINGTIANFIQSPQGRDKRAVHSLGEFITFLSVTDSYSWKDIATSYYLEHLDRFPYLSIFYYSLFFLFKTYAINICWPDMWSGRSRIILFWSTLYRVPRPSNDNWIPGRKQAKVFPHSSHSFPPVLIHCVLLVCLVGNKLMMFHVYFLLNIAKPNGKTMKQVMQDYDGLCGVPPQRMKESLQREVALIHSSYNFPNLYNHIGLPCPSTEALYASLRNAVRNSFAKRYTVEPRPVPVVFPPPPPRYSYWGGY